MKPTFRTAIVAGASSFLGMACAEHLAGEGYGLVLIDRHRDRLNAQADVLSTRTRCAVEVCEADLRCAVHASLVAEKIRQDASIFLFVCIDSDRAAAHDDADEQASRHDAWIRAAADDLGRRCGGARVHRAIVTVIAART